MLLSIILICIFFVVVVARQLFVYYEVKNMTYEKFTAKCKECIDKKDMSKLRTLLSRHMYLVLTHFNELQVFLIDYARDNQCDNN